MKRSPRRATERDELIALAIASGKSRAEAAEAAGVSTRTVYLKLADPAFIALVNSTRARIIGEAVGKLAGAASAAVDALASLAKAADSDSARVSAAKAILQQLVAIRVHEELEARVTELEGRADGQKSW